MTGGWRVEIPAIKKQLIHCCMNLICKRNTAINKCVCLIFIHARGHFWGMLIQSLICDGRRGCRGHPDTSWNSSAFFRSRRELQNVSAQADKLQASAHWCHHNLIKHSKSSSIYTKREQRLADIKTNVQQKPLLCRELFRNQPLTLHTACGDWKLV